MTYKWIGKKVSRIDAPGKVSGETKYMTDISFPDMYWGKIVRAEVAHARIIEIDVSAVEAYPGVHCVVTYKDVPGVNGYGMATYDQPVFAKEKIRFYGEPIAGIVAESKAIAEEAAKQIRFTYEELPVVHDLLLAMEEDSVPIHEKGNVLFHRHFVNGDAKASFAEADLIVEEEYQTSTQSPSYLELEGGVGVYEEGELTVYCGTQHPDMDRKQLCDILAMPKEKIRIVGYPVGGAFGGKVDLTVQAQIGVMAYKARGKVKVINSREESFSSCWKRHAMQIRMKTAVRQDGTILGNQVEVIADTGAYAGLGEPVVNLALEHACGAYMVPNVILDGYAIYTNNSVSSAMRGFGVPQANFAMESQIELIAKALKMDPLELRLKNGVKTGDKAILGHTLSLAMGTLNTLEKIREIPLWVEKEQFKCTNSKWKRRGVGIATSIQGAGLGRGLQDDANADIKLLKDGRFNLCVGSPDLGQGNLTAFVQIAAEQLGCDVGCLDTHCADTQCTPDSGATVASRTIYGVGNAILDAVNTFKEQATKFIAEAYSLDSKQIQFIPEGVSVGDSSISYSELAEMVAKEDASLDACGFFSFPEADIEIEGAIGLPHLLYSAVSHVALVEVDVLTGEVEVLEVACIPDTGRVINMQGLEAQVEGGTVMGMGYATMENTILKDGKVLTDNFNTYLIPTALDCPKIDTYPVEVLEESGPFAAKGIGECVGNSITSAVINGIYDAVGARITSLPADMERVLSTMEINSERGESCE
jgi:CO/xanthine dehydrogenase Mo-binding subunit